jgi:hypothetical protein
MPAPTKASPLSVFATSRPQRSSKLSYKDPRSNSCRRPCLKVRSLMSSPSALARCQDSLISSLLCFFLQLPVDELKHVHACLGKPGRLLHAVEEQLHQSRGVNLLEFEALADA